jgi:DNA modification methylase
MPSGARDLIRILRGDCRDVLKTLPDESVHCVVTSPPYFGLRDYGVEGQIGIEPTPDEFVAAMVEVFREVRRVLRKDGTCWLNLGDSYANTGNANPTMHNSTLGKKPGEKGCHMPQPVKIIPPGLKPKDLIGIPWRVAFALQADGWYLRQDLIWAKPNPMPESVRDRCTKAHEYLFLLAKSERYYFDAEAIAEDAAPPGPTNPRASYGGRMPSELRGEAGKQPSKIVRGGRDYFLTEVADPTKRNKRSVWTVATQPFKEAHFATFPPDLIEPCIKAGCPKDGTVLDPFGGAGTTGLVADRLGRQAILIELNPEYADMATRRIQGDASLFAQVNLTDVTESIIQIAKIGAPSPDAPIAVCECPLPYRALVPEVHHESCPMVAHLWEKPTNA